MVAGSNMPLDGKVPIESTCVHTDQTQTLHFFLCFLPWLLLIVRCFKMLFLNISFFLTLHLGLLIFYCIY